MHLDIRLAEFGGQKYRGVFSRTTFKPFDIIAEVRGSVIRLSKLKALISSETVNLSRLPLLLYFDSSRKLLISPKNISAYIF